MKKKRNSSYFNKSTLLVGLILIILLILVGLYFKGITGNAILDSYINTAYATPLDVFHENVSMFNISYDSLTAVDDVVNLSLNVSLKGYIYKKGYIYNFQTKSWEIFSFDQGTVGASYWIKDFASKDLVINVSRALKNGENYIVAYACQKINNSWQCGCQTADQQNCTRWMLHKFNVSNILIAADECVTDADCLSVGGSCIEGSCLSGPPCLSSCSCADTLREGETCEDGCGGVCNGKISRDGTSSYPFAIYNWTGLNNIRNNLNASYILMNDLTANDSDYISSWTPIGDSVISFSGNFDGSGHTISTLVINQPSSNNVGLFGYVYGGSISNVGLINAIIIGSSNVGGLVGDQSSGIISNTYVTGNITGNSNVGGLVGYYNGMISDSYSTAFLVGSSNVGGLIGYLSSSIGAEITRSYWDMNTSGISMSAGGIGKTTEQMKDSGTFAGWNTNIWNITSSDYPSLK
jgi:hypothetical protein